MPLRGHHVLPHLAHTLREKKARCRDQEEHESDAEQPVGTVVQAAPAPDGRWAALVSMQIAALDAGPLHAVSANGPALKVEPLPYPLLADI